ncbi:hypothetical protein BV22DRAFT_1131521 [Leucogyrophana mollusca]|uniref:Uncharacterized protein n=1 Tax=Leucogyrophana mollusca TaxID=85980 RepID=A0ACB8BA89_9AGAM|nr:hypothetical protein BV22DRAFT_1131521 [Leucogyrophana mollusca]
MAGYASPKVTRQHEATQRWLHKPGVRAAQNEKARQRMARIRRNKKLHVDDSPDHLPDLSPSAIPSRCNSRARSGSPSSYHDDPSPQNSDEDGTDHTHLPTSMLEIDATSVAPPTVLSVRQSVVDWQISWGPESAWGKAFNDTLRKAREHGHRGADQFFADCDRHAREGRTILRDLKRLAYGPCRGGGKHVREQFIHIHDMLLAVVSEVKFFEVKLDEYAPAVPMSKMSEIRYYYGM